MEKNANLSGYEKSYMANPLNEFVDQNAKWKNCWETPYKAVLNKKLDEGFKPTGEIKTFGDSPWYVLAKGDEIWYYNAKTDVAKSNFKLEGESK